jgi:hypothetical protein
VSAAENSAGVSTQFQRNIKRAYDPANFEESRVIARDYSIFDCCALMGPRLASRMVPQTTRSSSSCCFSTGSGGTRGSYAGGTVPVNCIAIGAGRVAGYIDEIEVVKGEGLQIGQVGIVPVWTIATSDTSAAVVLQHHPVRFQCVQNVLVDCRISRYVEVSFQSSPSSLGWDGVGVDIAGVRGRPFPTAGQRIGVAGIGVIDCETKRVW